MKKIFVNFVVLAVVAMPLVAALPAQAAPPPNWNVSGTWVMTFEYQSSPYAHDMTLTQSGGALNGSGGYPAGASSYEYAWTIDSGTVSGNNINFTAHYTVGAVGTTMQVVGTIASDGSMSGTWSDNYGGPRTGAWTAASTCTPVPGVATQIDALPVTTAAVVAASSQNITGKLAVSGCQVGVYVGPTVTGVTITATVKNAFYAGIDVDGGNANVTGSTISNVGDTPLDGVQYGFGVLYATNGAAGAIGSITNTKISSYQKAGIKAVGAGTTVTVSGDTVTGNGPITYIAQNGVEFVSGAAGIIKNNQVSKNNYTATPTDNPNDYACPGEDYFYTPAGGWSATTTCSLSGGILLYDAAPTVTVSNNTVSSNDMGAVFYSDPPATSYVVSNNTFQKNYGYGLVFDSANGTSTNNYFLNNPVGLPVTDNSATSTVTSLNDQFLNNNVNNEAIDAGAGFHENLVVETSAWPFHFPLPGPHGPRFPKW